eukprot:gene5719-19003_t
MAYCRTQCERRQFALQGLIAEGAFSDDCQSVIAYDQDLLRLTSEKLVQRAGYPARTLHTVAVKACPLTNVFAEAFKDRQFGAEVASLGELHQALRAGSEPMTIVFDPPSLFSYKSCPSTTSLSAPPRLLL